MLGSGLVPDRKARFWSWLFSHPRPRERVLPWPPCHLLRLELGSGVWLTEVQGGVWRLSQRGPPRALRYRFCWLLHKLITARCPCSPASEFTQSLSGDYVPKPPWQPGALITTWCSGLQLRSREASRFRVPCQHATARPDLWSHEKCWPPPGPDGDGGRQLPGNSCHCGPECFLSPDCINLGGPPSVVLMFAVHSKHT